MSLFKRHPLVFAVVGIVVITGALAVGANFLVQHGPLSTVLQHTINVRKVHVLGSAMYPTLKDNQIVDLDTSAYTKHPPQHGDIVLFASPAAASRLLIKRVIAIPGDRLRITNAVVYINGSPIAEPYLPEQWTVDNSWPVSGQDQLVPPNQYFVMGDNRNHSSDSRSFGFVPLTSIQGRITP